MASDNPQPLSEAIERALTERPFALRFWDGSAVEATEPDAATITVRSPQAISHIVGAPGELGVGRAYVTGEIEVDEIDKMIRLLGRWKPPPMGKLDKARILKAALQAGGTKRAPDPPASELEPGDEKHSKERDSEAVRHHYDVSNEFFALFLDESMTYSCGYFADGTDSLEDAQLAKLDLVCRKLGLEPGKRVLDIGCGWGSFAIHAAREHGADVLGITLSPPQAELARERVAEAGLDDKVEIEVRDYRDVDGEFDAVSSIGMIEHVGEPNIDEYASVIARALGDGGRVLNHGITATGPETHLPADFSQRYVFPDAEIPPLSRVLVAFERAGLEPLHVENLHADYIETLSHWAERLDQNLEKAEELAGPERVRVWRLYLRAARNGFELGDTSVFQALLSRPISRRPDEAPATAVASRLPSPASAAS